MYAWLVWIGAAGVLGVAAMLEKCEEELGRAPRWSYGSAVGLWPAGPPGTPSRATAAFGATLITATLTIVPLLGRTPPPSRWPRGFLGTCVAVRGDGRRGGRPARSLARKPHLVGTIADVDASKSDCYYGR